MQDIIVSWSGGKDSAFALHTLLQSKDFRVIGLLSTISESTERLPVHEVSRELLHAQASSLKLPLYEVSMPNNASNLQYETILGTQFKKLSQEGVNSIAYADIYLEDIRTYREQLLQKYKMTGVYPLWGKGTSKIAKQFIQEGYKAVVTTVDRDVLPQSLVGAMFNDSFLHDLPVEVDPCGERGEFHTFVYDGPIFETPISIRKGRVFSSHTKRFAHVDLVLG
ncbi:ATP-binding protein [Oceanobacillus kapialis]|uniref:Dph6-related ATP pyrophosphatase n=1 Tax=Oceanobacillus kapialis TaxID=481353 RepID=UPI00384BA958